MKKAFTLAEILIVLTIIGVMAVMTIPSLIQNSNSQQKITMFKKGFNAISNAYATEFAVKTPPKKSQYSKMWDALNEQINVKYYVHRETGEKFYTLKDAKKYSPVLVIIVAEDGIGYKVGCSRDLECESKLNANNHKKTSEILTTSCMCAAVILDKNYTSSAEKSCYEDVYGGDSQDLNNITCNTLWFPVTTDGITSGNPDCTISGRIISGVNPRPSSCDE